MIVLSGTKKNYLYQLAYQILTILTPLVTSPYLSRVIGADGLGEFAYSFSVVKMFSFFVLLGINNHGTRTIAKVKMKKRDVSIQFWSLYCIQLFMGILVAVLYLLYVMFAMNSQLAIIQFLYLVSAILDINWLFFGLEKFKITVTRNVIIKCMTVILVLLLVRDASDLGKYTLIIAGGFFCSSFVLINFAVKEIELVKIDELNIKDNIKPLLLLFVPVVASSIFNYMDEVMLGIMCPQNELGFYDNSKKVVSIPMSILKSMGIVMLPRITNMLAEGKKKDIEKSIRFSMTITMAMAFAISFGIAGISETFAPVFWGEQYKKCGVLIKIMTITPVFFGWADVIRTQHLIPMQRDFVFVKATIYGAITNLILNYMLIGKYGAMGAAIATVVAELVLAVYQTLKCRKSIAGMRYVLDALPFATVGVAMYLVIKCVSRWSVRAGLKLFYEIGIGGMVYVVLAGLYLFLMKKRLFGHNCG